MFTCMVEVWHDSGNTETLARRRVTMVYAAYLSKNEKSAFVVRHSSFTFRFLRVGIWNSNSKFLYKPYPYGSMTLFDAALSACLSGTSTRHSERCAAIREI
jgi:hypothetical protein